MKDQTYQWVWGRTTVLYDWNDDRVIVSHSTKKILLTFDDGPSQHLDAILDILNKENVQGLFFWQSQFIQMDLPVWEPLLNSGHVIGSHAHSHPELPKLSLEEQRKEISQSKMILEKAIGQPIVWFRPPYGLYNEDTMQLSKSFGLQIVLWKVASWDWRHEEDPDTILQNVETFTQPGDLILLHELPQTVQVLPALIQRLKAKGYEFVKPHEKLVFD